MLKSKLKMLLIKVYGLKFLLKEIAKYLIMLNIYFY